MAGRENELLTLIRKIDTIRELQTAVEELEGILYYLHDSESSVLEGEENTKASRDPNLAQRATEASDALGEFNKALGEL